MSEIDRLESAVKQLVSHVTALESENTALKAKEPGTPDSVLTPLITEIEGVIGPVADPDTATSASTSTSSSTSTSATTTTTSGPASSVTAFTG